MVCGVALRSDIHSHIATYGVLDTALLRLAELEDQACFPPCSDMAEALTPQHHRAF